MKNKIKRRIKLSCCGCNKKIDQEEYNELKEFLEEEIKEYTVVDCMDEDGKPAKYVEVEFEEYVLEVEDIDYNNITLDTIIDSIIRNNMK